MRVSDVLKRLEKELIQLSGYPYAEGSQVDPAEAFAFGLAIGTVSSLQAEWEQREDAKSHD